MTQPATQLRPGRLDYSVPESSYHTGTEISFSTLKYALISPLHYRAACARKYADTPSKRLGRLSHVAALQPHRLGELYRVWDGTRRGKAWDVFEATATSAGLEVVTASEMAAAEVIRDAVQRHPAASVLLAHGDPEVSCYWDEDGDDFRGRFDWLTDESSAPVVLDLKLTKCAGAREFGSDAAHYHYPMQAAMYLRGYKAATGHDATYLWLAVENVEPHDVVIYEAGEEDIELGEDELTRAHDAVRVARGLDSWPGRCTYRMPIRLPRWAFPWRGDDDEGAEGIGLTADGKEIG